MSRLAHSTDWRLIQTGDAYRMQPEFEAVPSGARVLVTGMLPEDVDALVEQLGDRLQKLAGAA